MTEHNQAPLSIWTEPSPLHRLSGSLLLGISRRALPSSMVRGEELPCDAVAAPQSGRLYTPAPHHPIGSRHPAESWSLCGPVSLLVECCRPGGRHEALSSTAQNGMSSHQLSGGSLVLMGWDRICSLSSHGNRPINALSVKTVGPWRRRTGSLSLPWPLGPKPDTLCRAGQSWPLWGTTWPERGCGLQLPDLPGAS